MTVRDLIDTLVRFDENKEIVFYNLVCLLKILPLSNYDQR